MGAEMTAVLDSVGWTVWGLVVLLAVFAWHTVLVMLLEGRRLRFMNAASAVALTWLASWFIILDLDKLHLIWMLPAVFLVLDLLSSRARAPRRNALHPRRHAQDRGAA